MLFKEVKHGTKMALSIIDGYKHSKLSTKSGLYAIYEKPSKAKKDIYDFYESYFYQKAREMGGYPNIIVNIGVTGNTFNFSIYCYISDGTKGDLYYITKSYDRVIKGVTLWAIFTTK